MSEITGKLKGIYWRDGLLWGNVFSDSKGRFQDGERIHVSEVQRVEVVTRNSRYEVEPGELMGQEIALQLASAQSALSSMKRERDSLQRQSEIDGARINSLTKERDEANEALATLDPASLRPQATGEKG